MTKQRRLTIDESSPAAKVRLPLLVTCFVRNKLVDDLPEFLTDDESLRNSWTGVEVNKKGDLKLNWGHRVELKWVCCQMYDKL